MSISRAFYHHRLWKDRGTVLHYSEHLHIGRFRTHWAALWWKSNLLRPRFPLVRGDVRFPWFLVEIVLPIGPLRLHLSVHFAPSKERLVVVN